MDRIEQGAARRGMVTASVIGTIMHARPATLPKIAQRLRDSGPEAFAAETSIPSLAWGRKYEDMAAGAFWEAHPEFEIENPGYLPYHDPASDYASFCGCSPDRVIVGGNLGYLATVELKCPHRLSNHIAYGLEGKVPDIYLPQVHFQMWCLNAGRAYFQSFHPLPSGNRRRHEFALDRDLLWDRKIEDALARFAPILLDERGIEA